MRSQLFLNFCLLLWLASSSNVSLAKPIVQGLADAAAQVLGENEVTRQQALRHLRDAGPEGLQALLETHASLLKQHLPVASLGRPVPMPAAATTPAAGSQKPVDPRTEAQWKLLQEALDAVGGQKDNVTAKLYWYTDLDQAQAAAHAAGKPILSLRLLGKLTDELSCANSRFFRTVLYPHAEINRELREKYILHWQTFRKVPIVTIDFGDGRKLVRTLTGNSIHYILDSQGRPIEAIPGLYGPPAFLREIQAGLKLHDKYSHAPVSQRETLLRDYHQEQARATLLAWNQDLATPANSQLNAVELEQKMTDDLWQTLATKHVADATLDPAGVAALQAKVPFDAKNAGRIAMSKTGVELPWLKMIRNLMGSMALDTIKNEYCLHLKMHEWFATGTVPTDLHPLNERVYAQLFLMPSSDPWLGLSTPDQFTGIFNGGRVEPASPDQSTASNQQAATVGSH